MRDVIGPAERVVMEKHLSSGCRKCQRTAELLYKLRACADADAQYQVPEYALHCARAIHLLQQPEKVHILPRINPTLIYDSFRDPLPAGVRTQQRIIRQTLYQAKEYSLDLRLEHERGSAAVTLIGQVANQKEPNKHVAGVPVFLLCGKVVVAHAVSNQFGEFHMAYEPKRRLRLYVAVKGNGSRWREGFV